MNDYLSLVGRGTNNYKDTFAPGAPMLAEDGDTVSMSSVVGSTDRLQWRLWIPPGTRSLQATMFLYASPPSAHVLMRMHQPPTGNLNSVTPENSAAVDLANVFAALLQGAEIPCYAPPEVGGVKLSDGRVDSNVVTATGGWLYISALQTPGAKIYELIARLTVDRAQYLAWYGSAVWDDQGNPLPGAQAPAPAPTPTPVNEKAVLQRVKDTGLDVALMELSGAKTDQELAQRALATGTWAALLKFASQ